MDIEKVLDAVGRLHNAVNDLAALERRAAEVGRDVSLQEQKDRLIARAREALRGVEGAFEEPVGSASRNPFSR